ncbi:unnamed protein product, partial [Effrenium voratum]
KSLWRRSGNKLVAEAMQLLWSLWMKKLKAARLSKIGECQSWRTGGGDANDGGHMICQEATQVIVPLGALYLLGYKIRWEEGICRIKHASRGPLPVRMRQFCPEVPTEVALRLVEELEEFNKGLLRRAMVSAERSDGRQEGKKGDRKSRSGEVAKAWRDGEMEKVKQLFPEVPEPIMEQALGSGGGKGSAWNRAARRRHARSAGVILHLLAGKSAKKFNYGELDREVVSWDEEIDDRFGYEEIGEEKRKKVEGDTILMLRMWILSTKSYVREEEWQRAKARGGVPPSVVTALEEVGFEDGAIGEKPPPAWSTLAIDVTGPFKVSEEGHRHLLVGSYVTAVSGGMAKEEDVAAEEIGDEDPFEELAEERGAVRGEEEEEGGEEIGEEGEHLAPGGQEGVVTRTLTLVEPLKSRRAVEVIAAPQSMVARLRWWGFEVTRLHSDRGRELVSTALRRWAVSHGLHRTLSSFDEPQANGRAEAAVGWVKRKARALLLAAE